MKRCMLILLVGCAAQPVDSTKFSQDLSYVKAEVGELKAKADVQIAAVKEIKATISTQKTVTYHTDVWLERSIVAGAFIGCLAFAYLVARRYGYWNQRSKRLQLESKSEQNSH